MPLTMYFPVRTWSRYKYRINPTYPTGSRGGNITPSLTHHPHSVVRAHHHTNVNPSPPPPLNNTPFSKIPRSLQTYVSGLKHAPGKSITAFLILHELTAVVPFGLVWWGVRTLDLVSVAEDPGGDGAVLGGAEDADGVGLWEEVHRVWRRWVDRGMETWGGYVSFFFFFFSFFFLFFLFSPHPPIASSLYIYIPLSTIYIHQAPSTKQGTT